MTKYNTKRQSKAELQAIELLIKHMNQPFFNNRRKRHKTNTMKRMHIPDELKRFDPKETGEETATEQAENAGVGESAGEGAGEEGAE